tara:strand:+ start:295 stop:591 length:297 start_codon:yes stop_codon:yes gene_type:complete
MERTAAFSGLVTDAMGRKPSFSEAPVVPGEVWGRSWQRPLTLREIPEKASAALSLHVVQFVAFEGHGLREWPVVIAPELSGSFVGDQRLPAHAADTKR